MHLEEVAALWKWIDLGAFEYMLMTSVFKSEQRTGEPSGAGLA